MTTPNTHRATTPTGVIKPVTTMTTPNTHRATTPTGVIKQPKLEPLKVRLEKLGLVRDWDFVLHLPLRYEDETRITPIGTLTTGAPVQIEGTVTDQRFVRTRSGQQFTATIADNTGDISARFIHYYPSVQKQLAVGSRVRLYGEPREGFYGGLEFVHPRVKTGKALDEALPQALTPVYPAGEGVQQRWLRKRIDRALLDLDIVDPVPKQGKALDEALPQALTPVYPAGEGVQQRWLRKRIDRALLDLDIVDPVPKQILEQYGFPGLREAITYLHTPPSDADVEGLQNHTCPAWRRLIFDELLAQQITLREMRAVASNRHAPILNATAKPLTEQFLKALPFALTRAQVRVTDEIRADLVTDRPMHRLVQGDESVRTL